MDSRHAKLLHEQGHLPIYYFPEEDVRMDLLEPTDHATHCPLKGDASYWSVRVGDRVAENAVWGYPDPIEGAPPLRRLRRASTGTRWTSGSRRTSRRSFTRAIPTTAWTCSRPRAT